MLVCVNVLNGVINQEITVTLSPADAGDLNANLKFLYLKHEICTFPDMGSYS